MTHNVIHEMTFLNLTFDPYVIELTHFFPTGQFFAPKLF